MVLLTLAFGQGCHLFMGELADFAVSLFIAVQQTFVQVFDALYSDWFVHGYGIAEDLLQALRDGIGYLVARAALHL